MSSIRLFILDAFERLGESHGHQIKLFAEQEHVALWTDFTAGAMYGAIKRLAADGLIAEVRTEREGNFPERQIYTITDDGRAVLARLRDDGLLHVALKPDPFDLAMSRLDIERLDQLPRTLDKRLGGLNELLRSTVDETARAMPYLTAIEAHGMRHREQRVRAEIMYLEELIAELPELLESERGRTDRDSPLVHPWIAT